MSDPAASLPLRYCRLAERLFHRGRRERAREVAYRAFHLEPLSEETARFCAWLFSNCGDHAAAASAYERVLALCPDWPAGHRHASGSFAIAGDTERALFHARRASDGEPASFEFALHAGSLCEAAGRLADARFYLARATAAAPATGEALRRLSGIALALGEAEEAVALALRAWRVDRTDGRNADHAAEALLRAGQYEEAVSVVADRLGQAPEDDGAWRKLSAAEMLCGNTEAALAAVERALALAPGNAEYHMHRAGLLHRLGRNAAAAEAYGRAAALDPSDAARRGQLAAYFAAGRYAEALAAGGALLHNAPENEDYAEAVLQVLNRRFDTAGNASLFAEGLPRPPRQPAPPRGVCVALATQLRVIEALIIRETRTRFGESKLGYGWALLEPLLHILTLSLFFAVLMHGRPPIGRQFFLFYYTGIIPYHLFVHTSSNVGYAITSNGSLLQLPLVSTFDAILARALLELVTDLIVATIVLAGFLAIGIGAVPHDLGGVAGALLTTWLFACGLGFLNAVLQVFCKSWDKVWVQVTRIQYFCSGIFYVPAIMPDWVRNILVWNPMLQGIDWFRASFFAQYDPHWLARGYLVIVALLTMLAGLGLERGLRRHLFEPA